MRYKPVILPILALLLLAGCSSLSVTSDYDSRYPLSAYRSYRWPTEVERKGDDDLLAQNPLLYRRVSSAVDRELAARGYQLREAGESDFIVTIQAGVKEKMRFQQPQFISYRWGVYRGRFGWYYPWWDPFFSYPSIITYEEGTLVIDIVDAKKNELAWRGAARRILRQYRNNEQLQADIDEAVSKILQKFPPPAVPAR
jgi:hypothetical protein